MEKENFHLSQQEKVEEKECNIMENDMFWHCYMKFTDELSKGQSIECDQTRLYIV